MAEAVPNAVCAKGAIQTREYHQRQYKQNIRYRSLNKMYVGASFWGWIGGCCKPFLCDMEPVTGSENTHAKDFTERPDWCVVIFSLFVRVCCGAWGPTCFHKPSACKASVVMAPKFTHVTGL